MRAHVCVCVCVCVVTGNSPAPATIPTSQCQQHVCATTVPCRVQSKQPVRATHATHTVTSTITICTLPYCLTVRISLYCGVKCGGLDEIPCSTPHTRLIIARHRPTSPHIAPLPRLNNSSSYTNTLGRAPVTFPATVAFILIWWRCLLYQ